MHSDEVVDILLRWHEASGKLDKLRKEMGDVVSQLENVKRQMVAAGTRAKALQSYWDVLQDRAEELKEEVEDLEKESYRVLGGDKK